MTQIQAYEDMSKEALIEHHLHTLQQHADDMDMLSKELACKSLTVPHGYRLVSLSDIDTAIQRAQVFDDGGDGADPESARSCIAILRSMIKTDRIVPVAAQAQWIEHCNITDIPDAVLTPSGLAIKNEQADTQEPIAWLDSGNLRAGSGNTSAFRVITAETKKGMPRGVAASFTTPLYAEPVESASFVLRYAAKVIELYDDATMRADYMLTSTDCAEILEALAEYFTVHPRVSEPQLVKVYKINDISGSVDSDLSQPCTCPSGDGSLRWPCPVHPPESVNLTKSSNQQV